MTCRNEEPVPNGERHDDQTHLGSGLNVREVAQWKAQLHDVIYQRREETINQWMVDDICVLDWSMDDRHLLVVTFQYLS